MIQRIRSAMELHKTLEILFPIRNEQTVAIGFIVTCVRNAGDLAEKVDNLAPTILRAYIKNMHKVCWFSHRQERAVG